MLMKKALFLFILFGLFCFAYFGRYQPVSLDVAKPTTITVEIKEKLSIRVFIRLKLMLL